MPVAVIVEPAVSCLRHLQVRPLKCFLRVEASSRGSSTRSTNRSI
ncbi:hypothetical protein SLEP1_g6163 [Rubroshorea leprosula]|uniref:Uncharacterized protein n=1 Tax=Rubroshorea leprosula TaxID=152421 RepID=A0AAV5I472_9ROSI|nr:hypothetical protein SLEP1_g6163 [Rubroshorea leprosula]